MRIKLQVSGETIFERDDVPDGVSLKIDIEQANERKYRLSLRKTFGMFRVMLAIWNKEQKMFEPRYESEYDLEEEVPEW